MAEEAVVHEIVAFDARQAERRARIGKMFDHVLAWKQCQRASLPQRPGLGGCSSCGLIIAGQQPVVRPDHVLALIHGDETCELLPVLRQNPAGAVLIEPLDVPWPTQKDTAQDQARHTFRMGLCVHQAQRGTP